MITMQFSPAVGKALYELIATAKRKGGSSKWWRDASAPLVDPQATGPSFHELLGEALKP